MKYQQRDVVFVEQELPDGKVETHPFLIISCRAANSNENYYTGVMMSATKYKDQFSFDLENNMFEANLQKEQCQLRLYIIVSFSEKKIKRFLNRMKRPHFLAVMNDIKDFVFSVDN